MDLAASINETGTTLPELFQAQVARSPERTAVEFEDVPLSYAELNARANRLAHRLIAHGAGPEQVVALAVPRSEDLVVALLAVLKSGAAYLPIDPSYPADRIAFMLADTSCRIVLVTPETIGVLPELKCPHLLLDSVANGQWPSTDPVDQDRLAPLHQDHPAYTSGSTGRPKRGGAAMRCPGEPGVVARLRIADRPAGPDRAVLRNQLRRLGHGDPVDATPWRVPGHARRADTAQPGAVRALARGQPGQRTARAQRDGRRGV
ncbi:hypothetical protein C1701_04485 [Actinoalloteichus sp. AHMU CJ021]|nr:hypothetical protein C1701_04485 [Actinoalloteichus sp. AHMU CJ021]